MRVVRVSPILLSSIMMFGTYSMASAQGISEMGAVHAMSAANSASVVNKSNADALTKSYGSINQMTGDGGGGGKKGKADDDEDPDHYDPHVTVKKAGKYSNDLYMKGKAKEAAGKLLEAEQFYRQSIAYRERIWGMNDPAVQTLTEKIGDLSAKRGALPEAQACYQRILMSLIKQHGQGEYIETPILTKLGQTYSKEKKYSDAINAFDQVYKLTERKNGASDVTTVKAAVNLAKAEVNQPEYVGDAVDLMKMYNDLLDKGDGTAQNTPAFLSVLDTYSDALEKSGKHDLSVSTKAKADKVREAIEAAKAAEKPAETSDKDADKKDDKAPAATDAKAAPAHDADKKKTTVTTKKAAVKAGSTKTTTKTTKTTKAPASSK